MPVTQYQLRTPRLLLRTWRDEDREPFAAMNADPAVMEYFPAMLSRAQSDALIDRVRAGFADRGWGWWAVEVAAGQQFIGFLGLSRVLFDATFTPAVEIGWRLRVDAWGHGYATEGGRATLAVGFQQLGLTEIVSFATAPNLRSQRVMQRLGMTHDVGGDFEHPSVPVESSLRRHVLYRRGRAT